MKKAEEVMAEGEDYCGPVKTSRKDFCIAPLGVGGCGWTISGQSFSNFSNVAKQKPVWLVFAGSQ